MDKSEKEKQILDLLMSRKDIRKLVEKSNECYSRMDFVGAMRYRQEIKDIVDRESKIMLTKSESLWSIFGGDWARVAGLNGLSNPSLIYPGLLLS